jgi:hypothetical protein
VEKIFFSLKTKAGSPTAVVSAGTRKIPQRGGRGCHSFFTIGTNLHIHPCYYPTPMADWLLTLGIIFIVIAIILMLLGFVGRVAWTIGKWLIIIFVVLALLSWVFSII